MASAVRARPAAGPRRAEAVEDALAAAKAQLKEAERQWARVADFAGQNPLRIEAARRRDELRATVKEHEQTLKEMRAESRRIAWLALVIVLLVVAAWFIADPDLAYRFFTGFSLPEFESDPAADGVAPPGAMPTGRFGGGGGGGAGGGHLHDDDDWLLDH